ncbi:MAG: dihydroneopterin aldolase, partial [Ginsengibacter sp.]
EEEKTLGNDYVIDASVEFHEDRHVIRSINETINYEEIYRIIQLRMDIPTPLLETVLMEIGNEIHVHYPGLKSINISIKKMHPPIAGIEGSAAVSYHKEF